MSLKNKIIAGLLALTLAVAIAPASTKAATLSMDEMQALITHLQTQIARLIKMVAEMKQTTTPITAQTTNQNSNQSAAQAANQTTGSQTFGSQTSNQVILKGTVTYPNGQVVTYSDPGYANPASCPAPANVVCADSANSSVVAGWLKNPADGACCQYSPVCQGPNASGWYVYSSKETCQAAKNSCVISGDSCVQNGKAYPFTNTCTGGTTPYIVQCANYGTYCVPRIGCSAGKTVVAANCDQACKSRGLASGKCDSLSSHFEGRLNVNPFDGGNTLGRTADCIADNEPGNDYCVCDVADEPNVPFPQSGYMGLDSMCQSICKTKGYIFGSCHVRVNDSNMICTGGGETFYAGTTNVCKPGAGYVAGCCCNEVAGNLIGALTNNSVPPVPPVDASKKANGQQCAAGSECQSGNCSYTYCAPAGSCGGVVDPMHFASGLYAKNQWFGGYCRNGVWKTALNDIGCDSAGLNFACDQGKCENNKCVSSSTDAKRADGATCSVDGDCVSNKCLGGYCGLKPNTWACASNGECASNSCVSGKCSGMVAFSNKRANGETCSSGGDCTSGVCSYTYCVQNNSECGGVENPMHFANGQFASNAWFGGYCRNGVWKVAQGNIGCGGDLSFPCDSGSCVNNRCQ